MNEKIPLPVTFNIHKHHFRYLLAQIEVWKNSNRNQFETTFTSIGKNLIDFYIGNLTVETICNEITQFLKINNLTDKTNFTNWVNPLAYRKIKLSDSSEWIIREGKSTDRFVHIHPAKKSLNTIRVRASTLKTVLAVIINSCRISENMDENMQKVNKTRIELLHLSPVKSLQRDNGIFQLWELFEKNYRTDASK